MTSLDQRHVEPEILDHLEPDDPRAVASRRDLRLLNGLMGQVAIAAGLLRDHVPTPPHRLLEIGSGDGVFMLRVARRLHRRWPSVHVTLLDRQDLVSPETRAAFEVLGSSSAPTPSPGTMRPSACARAFAGPNCRRYGRKQPLTG
jgi:hypothetical protein